MHSFSFFGRERSFYRRPQTPTNKPKHHVKPREEQQSLPPATSGLTGTVGPGIMARFRRLFHTIRRSEERSDVADIFQYTPSQNPEEFLENLQKNTGDKEWDRLSRYEVTSVPPDSPIPEGHTRFVCISCTHSTHRRMHVPHGDVLIHCGDFTERGFMKEVIEFNDWLGKLPHKHKIVIAGNHEISFDKEIMESLKKSENMRFRVHRNIPESIWRSWQAVLTNCTYLEDTETSINGIRIYGSPWQPNCGSLAFNLKREPRWINDRHERKM
uniref:metallophosphoesterase domain-containing protein 1-like isoform X2 n=1 Tax=Styela clava TaxID=7725 RepID=UPI001939799A|nr:metallophosphoesterase domain-containing protein 1-like isoform X2 [Styela clava]